MNDSLTQIQSICQHGIALAEKATKGPLKVETVRTSSGICHKIGPLPGHHGKEPGYACIYVDYPGRGPREAELLGTADLFAAAPTLLPAALTALQEAVAALEDMLVCTCARPAKVLPGGGVQAPGDHTPKCIMYRRQAALARIAASLTEAQTP